MTASGRHLNGIGGLKNNMRILVAGASGFIGKNFLLDRKNKPGKVYAIYNKSKDFPGFLKSNGLKNVRPFQCDFSRKEDVISLSRRIGKKFDAVLYLAANSDPAVSFGDPGYDLKANTVSLLNFLTIFTCKRFVYFSSGAVYDGMVGPVSPKRTTVSPTLPYAISKFACENYVKAFQKRYKTINNFVILRFFGSYGPYEPERKIYTKLVNRFVLDRKNDFTVTGNGKNLIDAMYVSDTISAINKVLTGGPKNLTLDLAIGKPVSINELVRSAGAVFGHKRVKINHKLSVPEYIRFYSQDNRLRRLYSFSPQVNLGEGLKRLSEFIKNRDNK